MDRFDGFQEFVVARGGALSRTAFLLTGEHHAAEDLVQAALAKAAARWRRICEGGEPEAYVRRIMVNERISWWRRRPATPVAQVPDAATSGHEQRIVDRIALGHALGRLSPRQRAAVVLRFYEDLSEAETAAAIGCSVGAVKRNTHDALVRLREALPLYAEQAGQYADAPTAVAAARRRRVGRIAGVAALILIPLLVAVTLLWPGLAGRHPLPPAESPSPSPAPILPPLPADVGDHRAGAPLLPRDRGIGLVTMRVRDMPGADYLVAVDGTWWRLPDPAWSLAPNGRWLAEAQWSLGQLVIRDLTGTQEHALSLPTGEIEWSPSGEWLFLRTAPELHGPSYLVSTRDWTVDEVDQELAGSVMTVLDSGELVLPRDHPQVRATRTQVGLRIVDHVTRASRELLIDASAYLGPTEDLILVQADDDTPFMNMLTWPSRGVLLGAGGVGAVAFFRRVPGQYPETYNGTVQSGLLEFSLADGHILRRVDLAGTKGLVADPVCYRGDELFWNDGTVLRRTPAGATYSTVAAPAGSDLVYYPAGCTTRLRVIGSVNPARH
ncbi:hypothetical protein Cs7R123_53470 [Catellatospora sp. TT07R-123]|nr:hypothetical protein Cs7R123_53470 [Catellatospora sp. TT07R-123]